MYIVATTSITSEGLWKSTAVCCLVQRAREGVNGSVFPSEMCSLTNDSQRKELIDQYRLKGLMGIIAPPVLGQVEGRNWLLICFLHRSQINTAVQCLLEDYSPSLTNMKL